MLLFSNLSAVSAGSVLLSYWASCVFTSFYVTAQAYGMSKCYCNVGARGVGATRLNAPGRSMPGRKASFGRLAALTSLGQTVAVSIIPPGGNFGKRLPWLLAIWVSLTYSYFYDAYDRDRFRVDYLPLTVPTLVKVLRLNGVNFVSKIWGVALKSS